MFNSTTIENMFHVYNNTINFAPIYFDMNRGRSFVVLPDGNIIPWEEYTHTPRVTTTLSDLDEHENKSDLAPTAGSIMKKPPMNIIIPRKTSESFRRHMGRTQLHYGRNNTVDSINVRDFLEPTIGKMNRRKPLNAEDYIHECTSFNIKRWK
jgi:hypothetical protein